ncbi:hypothetical protein Tsp_01345 [Trichinella spiralis]|uniref:hypothetical protein n=1 Tax=Trichinella spiralis TaxID=6334 RepID=UPI0001EFD05F|nr:hypothetical protein Tsp_01345 [Trichinella spiralis]
MDYYYGTMVACRCLMSRRQSWTEFCDFVLLMLFPFGPGPFLGILYAESGRVLHFKLGPCLTDGQVLRNKLNKSKIAIGFTSFAFATIWISTFKHGFVRMLPQQPTFEIHFGHFDRRLHDHIGAFEHLDRRLADPVVEVVPQGNDKLCGHDITGMGGDHPQAEDPVKTKVFVDEFFHRLAVSD